MLAFPLSLPEYRDRGQYQRDYNPRRKAENPITGLAASRALSPCIECFPINMFLSFVLIMLTHLRESVAVAINIKTLSTSMKDAVYTSNIEFWLEPQLAEKNEE